MHSQKIVEENGMLQAVPDAVQEGSRHIHDLVEKAAGLQGATREMCPDQQCQHPQQPSRRAHPAYRQVSLAIQR